MKETCGSIFSGRFAGFPFQPISCPVYPRLTLKRFNGDPEIRFSFDLNDSGSLGQNLRIMFKKQNKTKQLSFSLSLVPFPHPETQAIVKLGFLLFFGGGPLSSAPG